MGTSHKTKHLAQNLTYIAKFSRQNVPPKPRTATYKNHKLYKTSILPFFNPYFNLSMFEVIFPNSVKHFRYHYQPKNIQIKMLWKPFGALRAAPLMDMTKKLNEKKTKKQSKTNRIHQCKRHSPPADIINRSQMLSCKSKK